MEIEILMRTILFQVMIAKSLKEVEIAVKVMCSKDMIAAVKDSAEEYKRLKENK